MWRQGCEHGCFFMLVQGSCNPRGNVCHGRDWRGGIWLLRRFFHRSGCSRSLFRHLPGIKERRLLLRLLLFLGFGLASAFLGLGCRLRMFYETMESVLPKMKVIIQGDSGTVDTVLPIEKFADINITEQATETTAETADSEE